MAESFDLIVIGTGVAARGVALPSRAAGWRVAVVDHRPFGGTCALRGCDPKKLLHGGADALDHARRMAGKGIVGDTAIDWPQLMAFKRTFTDPFPQQQADMYAAKGIATFNGRARFTGPQSLAVNGTTITARHIVIATGAKPATLGIPGEEYLVTNEDFLSLPSLPRRIAMVGGGYIAAEFSHIAARAGADVTVLQSQDRMLPIFEPDLVDLLMERFAKLGIDVRCKTAVQSVEKTGSTYRVKAESDGRDATVEADLVVHAAGRAPNLEDLDLEQGEVAVDRGRLTLNEFLQSISNPAVYAAGDAAAVGPPLTPVSSHDASVIAMNLLEGNRRKPDYRGVPSVVFTIPPLATVGLSESEARKKGLKFRTQTRNASDWFTAFQAAEPVYGFKILIEEDTDRILGAHLVGPHVEEVINLFALAIRHDLPAKALKSTIYAYPTASSDVESMIG
jgi:glutathione reductase (NADPH)